MTPVRVALSAIFVLTLSLADRVDASPLADGCAGGLDKWGGCIHLVGDGEFYVQTIRAGVTAGTHDGGTSCGTFKASLQRAGEDNPNTIHTSSYRCIDVGHGKTWGPTWGQYRFYGDGDTFCGWWTGYHPERRGCVVISG